MFIGLYKKPVFIIGSVVGFYLFATALLDFLKIVVFYDEPPLFEMICGSVLLFMPTLIVIVAVRQFNSNPSFQSDITYNFSDDSIVVQGTTFKSEISWAHIIKQKEIGRFLILYHSKKFGNLIDTSKLTADQLFFIKEKIEKR